MSDARFKVDDLVHKPKGYRFVGTVQSVFTKRDGQVRYVVENGDGLLHIFNGAQLEPVFRPSQQRPMSGIGGEFQKTLGDQDVEGEAQKDQDR